LIAEIFDHFSLSKARRLFNDNTCDGFVQLNFSWESGAGSYAARNGEAEGFGSAPRMNPMSVVRMPSWLKTSKTRVIGREPTALKDGGRN
jgi:hypothetical protein